MMRYSVRFGAMSVFAFLLPLGGVHAATLTTLYAFQGGSDGANPSTALIRDSAGNLYGATSAGGGGCSSSYGCGTIFKLALDGTETVLHALNGTTDGVVPSGELIRDGAGNLYGSAIEGGSGCGYEATCGTVFKLATDGTFTVLHDFLGGPTDGGWPEGGLLRTAGGNFYGITYLGGSSSSGDCALNPPGCGTIYEVARTGPEGVLYSFQGGTDGHNPQGTPVADSAGNLYGTTYEGGTGCSNVGNRDGCGTVWEVTPNGTHTVIYTFSGGSDGYFPTAGLRMDSGGNLYGATHFGGNNSCGCGTVFKLAPDGTLTVLHTFSGGSDGADPTDGALIVGAKGNIFGETSEGGNSSCGYGYGCGTVFEITSGGLYGVLYSFSGGSDGTYPEDGLRQSGKTLYGVTEAGGDSSCNSGYGCGTVFQLTE